MSATITLGSPGDVLAFELGQLVRASRGWPRKWALRRRGRRIVASQVPDKRHRTRHGCLVVTAIDRVRGEITVGPVP